jgi:deazaflavin-dependent oxidoreductase (nitroreductase family)
MININSLGATRFGVWGIKHLVSPLQRWVYQTSDGKALISVGPGRHVLLLTTIGRRTGKERTIPVFYLRDGETIVICNVRPKHERTNPWVINLRSHPTALLQLGRDTAEYHAQEATENETDRLWPKLIQLWPAFKVHYENGGQRTIFILTLA